MMKYYVILIFFLFPLKAEKVTSQKINFNIDYGEFLSGQDMVFDTLTTNWHEGAFTGNGLLGNMVYRKENGSVRIEIGRTDVVDHRPEFGLQYGEFRLPIGHFELKPESRINDISGRLNIYDAAFEGQINQQLKFRTYTHALYNVIVLEIKKGITGYELTWHPELSVSPRYHRQNKLAGFAPKNYKPNPEPELFESEDVNYCYQSLLAGGGYCTAWKKTETPEKDIWFITVGNSWPQDISIREAKNNLELVSQIPLNQLFDQHTEWWHRFYISSFVSLPDKQFENFWWIQQYKLGSATRKDAPAIDLLGPWYRHTPWAAWWFNLNVQLTYSPVYASNRLNLGQSMISFINNNREQLIKNVPEKYRHNSAALGRNASFNMAASIDLENPQYPDTEENAHLPGALKRGETRSELGNLTWLLHNYWYQYRYSMNDRILKDLYPLLKRSINYYINIMQKWDDEKLHLPVTYSPEYPGGFTRDCNYDLALFRWGCETLLKANDLLAANDSLAETWQYVLENLVDYPVNENGLMIGRDVPFAQSHRHYSHLMMWYPLHIMAPSEENIKLMEKSIAHWHSFDKALQGYSFTGGASMYAKMGEGNRAYSYLKTFMTDFLRPNTMYMEAGPVMETPLSAVASINEMLLQSWGDTIRVFPAIPDDWQDVVFHDLRTEGAFLVSAEMKNGELQWVNITSEAGGTFHMKLPASLQNFIIIKNNQKEPFEGKDYRLELNPGEEIIIHKKNRNEFSIREVKKEQGTYNAFGAKK